MPTQTTLSRVESFPFDSRSDGYDADGYPVYDRAVGASMLRETFKKFFSDGVFPSPGNALQISKGSGLTVTIQPGIFIIRGAMGGYLTDAHSLTLDTAAPQGNVAYGVMLRYDETEQRRSCYLRVVRGDAGSSPTPPAPDQSTPGVMEYRLGYVTVPTGATDLSGATVTNEKGLAVCPYAAPFEEIDMSEVTADAKVSASEALTQLLAYFEQYREMIDAAVDGTLAGSLQEQINSLKSQVENFDLSDSVDDTSIEYTQKLPEDVNYRLRVKSSGITSDKIADGSVTTDKIANLAIVRGKLSYDLQSKIGVLDPTSWDADTYIEFVQTLDDGEKTTFATQYATSEVLGSWDGSDVATFVMLLPSGTQSTVFGRIDLNDFTFVNLASACEGVTSSLRGKLVRKTKSVALSGLGTHAFRVIGADHDTKTAGGKASLSFFAEDVVKAPLTYQLINNFYVSSSEIQEFLGTTMPSAAPSDLTAAVKQVTKKVTQGGPVNQSYWFIAYSEVTSDNYYLGDVGDEGEQYDYFSDITSTSSNVAKTNRKWKGAGTSWQLRSQISNIPSYQAYNAGIQLGNDGSVNRATHGMVPGFCI